MPSEHTMQNYTSSNMRKHVAANPLQRYLLEQFHTQVRSLFHEVQPAPRRILDAGCGEGFAMRAVMGNADADIVGLDGSPEALLLAHQFNPQRSFTAGDLFHLPFPDRSFDLVVCMEVLEHLDGPQRGLQELCRVSNDWLLLSVPNEPLFRGANFLRGKNVQAWGNDPGHVNHWPARSFLRFVGAACEIVSWKTSFPWTIVLARVPKAS